MSIHHFGFLDKGYYPTQWPYPGSAPVKVSWEIMKVQLFWYSGLYYGGFDQFGVCMHIDKVS